MAKLFQLACITYAVKRMNRPIRQRAVHSPCFMFRWVAHSCNVVFVVRTCVHRHEYIEPHSLRTGYSGFHGKVGEKGGGPLLAEK